MRLSPDDRAQFRRELPFFVLALVLWFVTLALMLALLPSSGVQS